MSGQPLQKPLDATKFRQQYLANIKLQTKIDEMNYQANKVYKKTGVPQQPTDQRTLNEKFRDIMGLKVEIRSMLKEITTGEQAQEIVNELSPNEVQYCYSNLPELIKILKPKYKGGVPAYIFIHTFRKFVDAETEGRDREKGFPQQKSGENIVLTLADMQPAIVNGSLGIRAVRGGLANEDVIFELLPVVMRVGDLIDPQSQSEAEFLIRTLAGDLPTPGELQYMYQGDYTTNPIAKSEIQQRMDGLARDMPSYNQVVELINQGERVQGIDQAEIFLRAVVMAFAIAPELGQEVGIIRQMMKKAVGDEAGYARDLAGGQGEEEEEYEDIEGEQLQFSSTGGGGPPAYIDPNNTNATLEQLQTYMTALNREDSGLFGRAKGEKLKSVRITKKRMLEFMRKYDADIKVAIGREVADAGVAVFTGNVALAEAAEEALDDNTISGVVSSGNGFKKKSGRPRTRSVQGKGLRRSDHLLPTDIDKTVGIPPAARFMPMGKLIINRNRLAENIISVKTSGGGFVKEFKSKKVSHNLANVVRKITGGSVLGYSDFDKMSQPEKDYLFQLSKRACILDKIDIPAPRIDNDERDIRQFEIMKGEMLAGNNSEQMIRKFKQIIVKLLEKRILPKNEGRDILVELTKAGF